MNHDSYAGSALTQGGRIQANNSRINAGLTTRWRTPGIEGEIGGEGASRGIGTREFQPALMRLRYPARNGQTQPGAAPVAFGTRARLVGAKKTLENAWPKLGGYADPRVRDADCVFLTAASASHGDSSKDRKSTRLNSSHTVISYAVFCLKKKSRIERSC